MRNAEAWTETKFKSSPSGLAATRETRYLAVSSRLAAQLVVEHYAQAITRFARGDLLDLGCGRVPFFGAYRPWVDGVTCVDWPNSLHTTPHVDLYCDLSQPLPLVDASFDTVIFSDVLEHLPNPELAYREIRRVLRPGGRLIMNTPFLYPIHEAPHDYLRHTRFSLLRLAERSGLHVVELTEIGGVVDILADTIAKLTSRLPLLGGMVSAVVQVIALCLGRSRLGGNLRKGTAASYPLGYFCVAQLQPDDRASPAHRGRRSE